jgi:hypothetical protein
MSGCPWRAIPGDPAGLPSAGDVAVWWLWLAGCLAAWPQCISQPAAPLGPC